jgi:Skp family chaperone for outer membrane proteins
MKKLLIPALIAVASVLPMHAQTILVIDVSGVFNNLIQVKATLQQINNTTETYKGYLQSAGQDLTNLQKKANDLQTQMENPANLQESRDAYRSQFATASTDVDTEKLKIQNFYQQSNDVIQKANQDLLQTQLEKIKVAVQGIAEKRKASLVLNSSALGMLASVIYSDKSMDITTDVLNELNADATAGAPAAATTETPATPSMAKPAATK